MTTKDLIDLTYKLSERWNLVYIVYSASINFSYLGITMYDMETFFSLLIPILAFSGLLYAAFSLNPLQRCVFGLTYILELHKRSVEERELLSKGKQKYRLVFSPVILKDKRKIEFLLILTISLLLNAIRLPMFWIFFVFSLIFFLYSIYELKIPLFTSFLVFVIQENIRLFEEVYNRYESKDYPTNIKQIQENIQNEMWNEAYARANQQLVTVSRETYEDIQIRYNERQGKTAFTMFLDKLEHMFNPTLTNNYVNYVKDDHFKNILQASKSFILTYSMKQGGHGRLNYDTVVEAAINIFNLLFKLMYFVGTNNFPSGVLSEENDGIKLNSSYFFSRTQGSESGSILERKALFPDQTIKTRMLNLGKLDSR